MVAINLHHSLRRGTSYGSSLPERVLEEDGVERGGVFLLTAAHRLQQSEFVPSQWTAGGNFISQGTKQDTLSAITEATVFSPSRKGRRAPAAPQASASVTVRGGEYFLMPDLRVLGWFAARKT
jgi:hypothetical protein